MDSNQPSSDTSAPSALIVSDDTGNLDNSWLNANYPFFPAPRLAQFALARILTSSLTHVSGPGVTPQYRNKQGRIVPAKTDMAGNQLPRFQFDMRGQSMGLLVEPASINLLAYDRVGLSAGVKLSGCARSTTTRTSVDGQSQLTGLTNSSATTAHSIILTQAEPSTGPMSATCALFGDGQQYYAISYTRPNDKTTQVALVDTVGMTVTSLLGTVSGRVSKDRFGWYWVELQLGTFSTLDVGTLTVQCMQDASTSVYASRPITWFVDALQLEVCAISTSPMFASASGVVSRGSDVVLSVVPQVYPSTWLDSDSNAGTVILEGHLPNFVPSAKNVCELCRFSADAQHYLMLGYSNQMQLGLYLTNGPDNMTLISSVTLAVGSLFKAAFAYDNGMLTGFAVNGKNSLSFGTLTNFVLPDNVMRSMNLSSGQVPVIWSQLCASDRMTNINQLKYLTSV
jgi:hypothetical protein